MQIGLGQWSTYLELLLHHMGGTDPLPPEQPPAEEAQEPEPTPRPSGIQA
ncbi:hypothetical protein [Streptomyces sp. VRA16 Mangrove soil]|nr:hypothetical protein [Streptomyces sp. VRA16 Mangrove soil]MBO1337171.1 hypothetical protein [Streptomyces sp. VRA16 Mangrove soil]